MRYLIIIHQILLYLNDFFEFLLLFFPASHIYTVWIVPHFYKCFSSHVHTHTWCCFVCNVCFRSSYFCNVIDLSSFIKSVALLPGHNDWSDVNSTCFMRTQCIDNQLCATTQSIPLIMERHLVYANSVKIQTYKPGLDGAWYSRQDLLLISNWRFSHLWSTHYERTRIKCLHFTACSDLHP